VCYQGNTIEGKVYGICLTAVFSSLLISFVGNRIYICRLVHIVHAVDQLCQHISKTKEQQDQLGNNHTATANWSEP
jgi:hypothetical protein